MALPDNAIAVKEIPGAGSRRKQLTGMESFPGQSLPMGLECQCIPADE